MNREQPAARRPARELVDADARYFLHQAASTPCLSAIRRAEGVWIEEIGGRRFMDFHGNSVHHLGYAHPKLVAALKAQLDALAFSPRGFTNAVAVALAKRLAALAPDPLGKVLFAPSGNDAIEIALRPCPRGDQAFQDGLLLGCLPRGGARGVERGWRSESTARG